MIKRSQPTGCISHPMPSILFLSGYSELTSLSFVYDQRETPIAINTGVTQYENTVLLPWDLGILLWDSMPAAGARQISCFSFAKRARSPCAPEDFEIPQAGLPLLRKLIALSYLLQQTLHPQMRQIRARGAWTVPKMQNKILGMHGPVLSNQLER